MGDDIRPPFLSRKGFKLTNSMKIYGLFFLFLLSACAIKNKPKFQDNANLAPSSWLLISLDNEDVNDTTITLNFDEENRINGYSGCNSFFASYSQNNDSLKIEKIGSTKRFCENLSALETLYLNGLERVVTFYFSDKKKYQLILLTDKNEKIIFNRK